MCCVCILCASHPSPVCLLCVISIFHIRLNVILIPVVSTDMLVFAMLCLFWSLVEVHSQTGYPYISFMGEILPNHTYVNLSLVGNDISGNDSVQCHTDLETCCSHKQDNRTYRIDHRGNWHPPGSDMRLPYRYESGDIYEEHRYRRTELHRRNNADRPTGIYRCFIPTNAVHNDTDPFVREFVYFGLYTSGGKDILCVP